MNDLHVFTNDSEWLIAREVDDVPVVLRETFGPTYDMSHDPEFAWYALDPAQSLTIRLNDDGTITPADEQGGTPTKKTCAEWIEHVARINPDPGSPREGARGYLCTTES